MATKKSKPKSKTTNKQIKRPLARPSAARSAKIRGWRRFLASANRRRKAFLRRRPHRTLKLSRRADYRRGLAIENYWQFSKLVFSLISRYRKFFAGLLLVTVLSSLILVGMLPQNTYNSLKEALNQTLANDSEISTDKLFRAALMFSATASTGGVAAGQDQVAAVFLILIALLIWLAVVWFMRNSLAGHDVSIRDALYKCFAPLIPMLGVIGVTLIQLVPVAIFTIIFAAAKNTDFVGAGVEGMVLYSLFGLVIVLTLYWLIGSFLALIVVTLPDIYPMEAIRISGDLVTGRRLTIILRLVWHLLQVLLLWIITILPLILIEDQLSSRWSWLKNLPVVQFAMITASMASLIWTAVYIYMLYRRLIEDESKPA